MRSVEVAEKIFSEEWTVYYPVRFIYKPIVDIAFRSRANLNNFICACVDVYRETRNTEIVYLFAPVYFAFYRKKGTDITDFDFEEIVKMLLDIEVEYVKPDTHKETKIIIDYVFHGIDGKLASLYDSSEKVFIGKMSVFDITDFEKITVLENYPLSEKDFYLVNHSRVLVVTSPSVGKLVKDIIELRVHKNLVTILFSNKSDGIRGFRFTKITKRFLNIDIS